MVFYVLMFSISKEQADHKKSSHPNAEIFLFRKIPALSDSKFLVFDLEWIASVFEH